MGVKLDRFCGLQHRNALAWDPRPEAGAFSLPADANETARRTSVGEMRRAVDSAILETAAIRASQSYRPRMGSGEDAGQGIGKAPQNGERDTGHVGDLA